MTDDIVDRGTSISYTITVTNNGPSNVTGRDGDRQFPEFS